MQKYKSRALIAAIVVLAAVPTALALAATTPAPIVSTAAATNVGPSSATLNGSVNPDGVATRYAFQWGTSTAYGEETAVTSAGSGTGSAAVDAVLSGLNAGTTYHYRIIALTATATVVGKDETLTTTGTAPAPETKPVVVTEAADQIGSTSATVTGTVNPGGHDTSYHFEYGTTADYGFETSGVDAGSGTSAATASAQLSGLPAGTTIHYRLVASSGAGITVGAGLTFKTTNPPLASTGSATGVGTSSATLNGTVDPDGSATTYAFQYGTTTAYGQQTATESAGSGTSGVSVHEVISGLSAGTTYHYRVVAVNANGTTYGDDATFAAGSQTSQVRLIGREGFVSPGGVIGIEVGCFDGTTDCSGTAKLTYDGTTIGSRSYTEGPETGGFQNVKLTAAGAKLLKRNKVFHLLTATATVTSGTQTVTGQLGLARWIWTD